MYLATTINCFELSRDVSNRSWDIELGRCLTYLYSFVNRVSRTFRNLVKKINRSRYRRENKWCYVTRRALPVDHVRARVRLILSDFQHTVLLFKVSITHLTTWRCRCTTANLSSILCFWLLVCEMSKLKLREYKRLPRVYGRPVYWISILGDQCFETCQYFQCSIISSEYIELFSLTVEIG